MSILPACAVQSEEKSSTPSSVAMAAK